MREIDFLDAVGRVDEKYVAECLLYQPPKKRRLPWRRLSAVAACLLLFCAVLLIYTRTLSRESGNVGESDGFLIENGTLLCYSGDETDVVIPETVGSIADFAFIDNPNAASITVVRLGANVQTVEVNAFAGLENLTDVLIADGNPSFVEKDGLLLSADGSILLRYERENETAFTLPASVRYVAAHAVQNARLEEIDFGQTLEYVGYNAFAGNARLKAIALPDSVKYIGEGAFSDCVAAVDGYVPANAECGDNAFHRVPFYNSMLAGQTCPGEEIARGLIAPREAVFKSDLEILTAQIEYVLAVLRGEDVEPDENALLAYGAIEERPTPPENTTLPESFSINDLTCADNGWNGAGIYDVQLQLSVGDSVLVMEAYAVAPYEALFWDDVFFRIARIYYVKNPDKENDAETLSAFGWSVAFDYEDGCCCGVAYTREDGTLLHSFLSVRSDEPYTLTFSPEGTRVAVEFVAGETAGFYVQSLNGDALMEPYYDYNEYLNRYYGQYEAGSLRWLDENNIEGVNEFGRFRFNIFEFHVEQLEEDPVALETDAAAFFNDIDAMGEADAFPSVPWSLRVNGFSTETVFQMSGGDRPETLTAWGRTVEIAPDVHLYGNCVARLFAYDDAIVFVWSFYDVGYVYILGDGFSQSVAPCDGSSVTLYLDDDGALKYKRSNQRMADIVQTGGLSAATDYDDFLYCVGAASIENGELSFGDAEEYYTIGERYDLDKEFVELGYDRDYASIEEVFAANQNQPRDGDVAERMLSMTVGELERKYGALKLEYSENGPGQPVYSLEKLYGVYLVFHNWNMDDPLTDDRIPDEIIVACEKEYRVLGFVLLRDISEFSTILSENDATASYSVINGIIQLNVDVDGAYSAECIVSEPNLNLPDETTAGAFDWKAWEEEYLRNPVGTILQIRIRRS